MKKRDSKREDKQNQDQAASIRNSNSSSQKSSTEEEKLLNVHQRDIISKNEVLAKNKEVILLLLSQKAKSVIINESYMRRINRKYYVAGNYYEKKKREKEAKKQGNEIIDPLPPFEAKYGLSIIYDLIKILDTAYLETHFVKIIYEYLFTNHPDKFSEEESASYQTNLENIKQRVWREKARRKNESERKKERKKERSARKEAKKKEDEEKFKKKVEDGQNKNVEDKQIQNPFEEIQINEVPQQQVLEQSISKSIILGIFHLVYSQLLEKPNAENSIKQANPKGKPSKLKIRSRYSIQRMESKTMDIKANVVPKKRQKLSDDPKSISPTEQDLTNMIVEELQQFNTDGLQTDGQRKESVEFGTLSYVGEPNNDNEQIDVQMEDLLLQEAKASQGNNSLNNERVSTPIIQQCSQTLIIKTRGSIKQTNEADKTKPTINDNNYNKSHDQIEEEDKSIEASQSEEVIIVKEVTPEKPQQSSFKLPLNNQLQGQGVKLRNQNQNLKLSQISQVKRSDTIPLKKGISSLQQSIMNQKAKQEQRAASVERRNENKIVSTVKMATRRVSADKDKVQLQKYQKSLEEEKHLKNYNLYQVQIYKQVKNLIPVTKEKSTPRKSQAKLCNKFLYYLPESRRCYLARESMDAVLDILVDLSKTSIMNWNHGPQKYIRQCVQLYNLTQESIFMEVGSGSGLHCIHATLRADCYSYGLDEILSAILGSYWLRGETKKYMDINHEPPITLCKTQFIHEDYVNLDMLAVGDFKAVHPSHVFITHLDTNQARFQKLIKVLEATTFRVLVWPVEQEQTLKYFQAIRNQIFWVKSITVVLEHDKEISLYFYVRSLPYDFETKRDRQKEQEATTTKYDSRKTLKQLDFIKNGELHIAVFKEPVTPEKAPEKQRWTRWNIVEFKKFKEEEKKLNSGTSTKRKPRQQEGQIEKFYANIRVEIHQQFPEITLTKLIYKGDQAVVLLGEQYQPLIQYAIKVSQKNYSEALVKEYQTVQFLLKNCNSKTFLPIVHNYRKYEIGLHTKEVQKDYQNSRVLILYQLYPMTLADLLQSNITRDLDVIKHLFMGIAYGVREIHKVNYAHCDLKLSNIFIDNRMKPIIGDFGYARKAVTSKFEILGTANFMPVEYFTETLSTMHTEYDYRKADIWSLGVILFEMVYRAVPFKFDQDENQMKIRLNTEEVERIFKCDFIPKVAPVNLEIDNTSLEKLLDLIQLMLKFDHTKRINIDMVIGHQFCKEIPASRFENKRWTFKDDTEFQAGFTQLKFDQQSKYKNVF